ncbi:MAG TPA: hypothetical protein VFB13_13060 [Reyranella sp.]|nr:hypothetical protein [Reyranella sp.]
MIRMLMQAAVLVAAGLALGGCPLEQAKTAAPAKKPPAPDYQQALVPTPKPPNLKAICYNDNDLAIMRARMLQQEMAVATLQCQTADGRRALDAEYTTFVTSKFRDELASNARSLQQLAGRKRFNVDIIVTEFANRMAQRAPVDREFCNRSQRALEWALDPKVASLSQVPPPYDLGPEMNIHPCSTP